MGPKLFSTHSFFTASEVIRPALVVKGFSCFDTLAQC